MIIFGLKGVTYTKDKGQFNCPSCQDKRMFKQKRVRRFFELYFIPIVPMDLLAEYVECQRCNSTFEVAVLNYDPAEEAAQFESQFVLAVRRVMVLMMLADGEIDAEEVNTIRRVFKEISGGHEMNKEELQAEINAARAEGKGVIEYLKSVSPMLNSNGKEEVIRAAFQVAAADGHIDESELLFIREIAESIDVSKSHLNGIMAELQTKLGLAHD